MLAASFYLAEEALFQFENAATADLSAHPPQSLARMENLYNTPIAADFDHVLY